MAVFQQNFIHKNRPEFAIPCDKVFETHKTNTNSFFIPYSPKAEKCASLLTVLDDDQRDSHNDYQHRNQNPDRCVGYLRGLNDNRIREDGAYQRSCGKKHEKQASQFHTPIS